jgi:hypothetical protein
MWRMLPAPVAAALIMLALPAAGNADTVSLTQTQLLGFTQQTASQAGTATGSAVPSGPGVKLSTEFDTSFSGEQSADVGLTSLSIAYTGGDSFSLNVFNVNENPWKFALFVTTSAGPVDTLPLTSIAVGSSALLSVLLPGGGPQTITGVTVRVSGDTPLGPLEDDWTAEYRVTPVPLPTALPLFAGGLGLLGFLSRRRRNRTAEALV